MIDQNAPTFQRDASHSAVVPGHRVIRSLEVAHIGSRQSVSSISPSSPSSTSPSMASPSPASPSPAHRHTNPTIELVKEGDVVRAIDVTCACGQIMRLWCQYETNSDESSGANVTSL